MKNTIKTVIELIAVSIIAYVEMENGVAITDITNALYDWLYYTVDLSEVISGGITLGLFLAMNYIIVDVLVSFVTKHIRVSFVFDEPEKELKETAEMKEAES